MPCLMNSLELLSSKTGLGLGAGNYIKNVLTKALGDDKAQSVLSRITPASSERPIEIWIGWMRVRSRNLSLMNIPNYRPCYFLFGVWLGG